MQQLFADFNIHKIDFMDDSGLSRSVSSAAQAFLDSLYSVAECFNPVMSLKELWELVQSKILSMEIRGIGYPLEGVQVLRLIESRYVPFDVIFILGCNEGKFPKQLPKDYILDDWLKRRIGLPGWAYVEALEDTTFSLLKARIPQVELFYTQAEGNRNFSPSRFLEIEKAQKGTVPTVYTSDWESFFAEETQFPQLAEEEQHQLQKKRFFQSTFSEV